MSNRGTKLLLEKGRDFSPARATPPHTAEVCALAEGAGPLRKPSSRVQVPTACLRLKLRHQVVGDFPGGAVVENLPANAGDTASSPGPGRSHMPRSN